MLTGQIAVVFRSGGGWDRSAAGLAGAARRLADSVGAPMTAIVIGETDEPLFDAVRLIADRAVVVRGSPLGSNDPESFLLALTATLSGMAPSVVLLGNDISGQEIAPRLAYRLNGSAAGDAVGIEMRDGVVCATRGAYGGKAVATLALRRSPAVVWLRARAFAPAEPTGRAPCDLEHVEIAPPRTQRLSLIERRDETVSAARLEDARVIVSGGRGLGGPEPFKDLEQLAGVLCGATAASRAACDAGWAPASWQVGQTGKKVAPELYLAVAISGASQHMMGISDAKIIAAINRDPEAPIFKHCRFGLVEDFRKVIGPLRERLARLQR